MYYGIKSLKIVQDLHIPVALCFCPRIIFLGVLSPHLPVPTIIPNDETISCDTDDKNYQNQTSMYGET